MKKLFDGSNKCSSRGVESTKISIKNGDNKRKKFIIISLTIILLMLTIGISFAVWNYSFVGSANTIDTGDVSLEFLESNTDIISMENAFPISDSDGKAQDETFNFAVTSKASKEINIKYTLKIENLSIDTGYTQLSDDEVKVYLTDYDDNMLVSPVKISDLSNYSLYSKLNSHSKTNTKITDKYKLRVWIDSEVEASKFYDEDANVVQPYQYKFKIGIQSTKNKQVPQIQYIAGVIQTFHQEQH